MSRRWSASDRTGCRSAPYTRLVVLEPAPNSGVLVLARMMPPALRTLATVKSSSRGTWSLNSSEPQVVRRPAEACRSLRPIGQAAEQPRVVAALDGIADRLGLPAAASASMATMAFTAALVASMRLRQLSISSSGDSSRAPIIRRASTAVRSQASLMLVSPHTSPWRGRMQRHGPSSPIAGRPSNETDEQGGRRCRRVFSAVDVDFSVIPAQAGTQCTSTITGRAPHGSPLRWTVYNGLRTLLAKGPGSRLRGDDVACVDWAE